MQEFKVNREKVVRYLSKYNINNPEDFLETLSIDKYNVKYFVAFEANEFAELVKLKTRLIDIFNSSALPLDNDAMDELMFIISYLKHFLDFGIYRNQEVVASNKNLLGLIDVLIALKTGKSPTSVTLNLTSFNKRYSSVGSISKGVSSEEIHFNTFNTPRHINTKDYLNSLIVFLNINPDNKTKDILFDPNTSIDKLCEYSIEHKVELVHQTEAILYIYTALLIDYLETEFGLLRKAKIISVKQAEIIYEVLSSLNLVNNTTINFDKLNAIDNFRNKITRNLSKYI